MNREKILFVVVAGIVVLWGTLTLIDPYRAKKVPPAGTLDVTAPQEKEIPPGDSQEEWLLSVVIGRKETGEMAGDQRSIIVPHTDLVDVAPAELDIPRELPTPWILPPVSPFPPVTFYRGFRVTEIARILGGPPEDAEPGGDVVDDPLQPDEMEPEETVEDILEGDKKEFVPEEWDALLPRAGGKMYGTIIVPAEAKKLGRTKYELLLPENDTFEFIFEHRDKKTLRIVTSAPMTLAESQIRAVEFQDNIGNRYWSKRTEDRVRSANAADLVDLGNWVMELAEEERYDRMTGLAFAVKTFREALEALPGDLAATLALGEALHRSFKWDEEYAVYEKAQSERSIPDLIARQVRILFKLNLHEDAITLLDRSLGMVPGDVNARNLRAEAYYTLGLYEDASEDFEEAERVGPPEMKTKAREGRARARLAAGRPGEAERILGSTDDAASLVTLGAALYAQMKWDEAAEAFRKAAELEPDSPEAVTNLGLALAHTATDWQGIEDALAALDRARSLSPLNYFYPPLGKGFAEQRRGEVSDQGFLNSVDHYVTARDAMPTDAYIHYVLGRSWLRDGKPTEAREEFGKALERDYRFADALLGSGTASLSLGEWGSARSYLTRAATLERRALEKGPKNVAPQAREGLILALYRLGRAFLLSEDIPEQKRLEEAKAVFGKVLEIDKQHVPSLNALGYILYEMGEVTDALDQFDTALSLAPDDPEHPDRKAGMANKGKITEILGRRLWVEGFDRPDSASVGNRWLQSPPKGTPMSPKLVDRKVVVTGRREQKGITWLTHGDVGAGSVRQNKLNLKFIRVDSLVTVARKNQAEFHFLVYLRGGRDDEARVTAGIGIECNERRQVSVIHRSGNNKNWVKIPVDGDDGQPMLWPERPVELSIVRTDHDRGQFAVRMDGRTLRTVDRSIRRSGSAMYFGFTWEGTAGALVESSVEEVELEVYQK